ncbi:hypothetical protein, partial [Steroidobacter sp.]|uniref:hypothetical protein n=1 Tax=Steroidobacter sp. TaxID=1978227 RepID=UPI001A6102DD
MQADPIGARLDALLRHLQTEQIQHVVADDEGRDSDGQRSKQTRHATVVVAVDAVPLLPGVLNDFCRRNDMLLAYHCARAGQELYMVSWLDQQQRPDFIALLVKRAAARQGSWWQRKSDAIRRWRTPSGLLIACLGPDGSGRTNV